MSFMNGYSVDVYSVKKSEYGVSGKVHAWHKDKKTGKYYTDFSGFANFRGEAAEKALQLGLPETMTNGDKNAPKKRIKITFGPDVTNRYIGKEKYDSLISAARGSQELTKFIMNNASPTSVTILDFEIDDYNDQENSGGKSNNTGHSGNRGSGSYGAKSNGSASKYATFEDDEPELPF